MSNLTEYLTRLDPDQHAAVTAPDDKSALVIAGPGSGKTRVLTGRAAYVVSEFDANPNQVFAVTFTNKAAQEVAQRAAALSDHSSQIFVGTFHRMCIATLSRAKGRGPVPENFSIADGSDARAVVYRTIDGLDISWARNRSTAAREVAGVFTMAKNRMVRPRECGATDAHILAEATFDRYNALLKEQHLMDFDDLLVVMHQLLDSGAADRLLERTQHLLVDEFQDTSMVQYKIALKFVEAGARLFAVGDPHQSIYTFRGADGAVMARAPQDIPNMDTHVVGFNYRSTPEIVRFAKQVITEDPIVMGSPMKTVRDKGLSVKFIEAKGPSHEARLLAERVLDSALPYSSHVVLVRSVFAATPVEKALQEAGIPYRMIRGSAMYERAEVKDLLAWLKVLVNPQDAESWKRAAKSAKCRVGESALDALHAAARESGQDSLKFLVDPSSELPSRSRTALQTLAAKFAQVVRFELASDAVAQVRELLGVSAWSGDDRQNVDQVYALACEKPWSVAEFVSETSQFSEAAAGDSQIESVDITTVHSSKGLEYPAVHIIGCDEGYFPSHRSLDDPAQMVDERRLFYVAVTRAESELYVSWPGRRMLRGVFKGFQQATPADFEDTVRSPFIPESAMKDFTSHLNKRMPQFQGPQGPARRSRALSNPSVQTRASQRRRSRPTTPQFVVGDDVISIAFGEGIVKAVELGTRQARVKFRGGVMRSVRWDELLKK